jgi:hypothetical protein
MEINPICLNSPRSVVLQGNMAILNKREPIKKGGADLLFHENDKSGAGLVGIERNHSYAILGLSFLSELNSR